MHHYFQLSSVSVVRRGTEILSSLTCTLPGEQMTVIFGSSGSGKTTFLRLLNMMTIPDEGTVSFNGEVLLNKNPLDFRSRVSLVQQEPVIFDGTVLDNVLLPFRYQRGRSTGPTEEQLDRILRLCQLSDDVVKRDASLLSGGEKQRVAIARSLLPEPEVLLLDEPTSALDIMLARTLMADIRSFRPDLTMIVVTHSLELIGMADSAIHLDRGRIAGTYDHLEPAIIEHLLSEGHISHQKEPSHE